MLEKLQKWAKHVKQWDAAEGPRWTRRQSSRGGFVWQTPCGQKKYELRPPVTAELERQQTDQQAGKTLSRVAKPAERKPANPEMDERKRKMDALAAKLRGEQEPEAKADGRGDAERAKQKKARREDEAAAAAVKAEAPT